MLVIRRDMTVVNAFVIISFFNRCLNPFIYASQYEVMRRAWAPMLEFLRRRVVAKPGAAAAIKIEQMPASASALSNTAGHQLSESVSHQ